jgi:hypothetical protein
MARDVAYAITEVFDYDGDGRAEVLVTARYVMPGLLDYEEHGGRLFSARNGRVALYERTAKISIADARDVNHDGRPDLIERPYQVEPDPDCDRECGLLNVDLPDVVWLSQPDGSFTQSHP